MKNPFEEINELLNQILNLLLDLKKKPVVVESKPRIDQYLTIKEAAEFLKLKVPTIYSKTSRGELPSFKRSKRLYFSREELENYLKEGKRKSQSELDKDAEDYLNDSK